MSDSVITVEGLSKRYVIEHESRHDNLRDTLHHAARKLWRRFRWGNGFRKEEFWALRDVSFEVRRGEVLGIIGRNGAGKSTLLKILSRITEPTSGRVTLRGRVASLLEVGTGFHPELSGRENVFLNGAILGMSRAEIRRKFDGIVAFAEVEQFLDTPVKHYSSGMYIRLAFAVAAHLEPEILIVDEVLAVGDTAFQQKCLGKIQAVARDSGRTVLFVSHNLAVIQSLCKRCLLMEQGLLAREGTPGEAIGHYLDEQTQNRWRRTQPVTSAGGFTEVSARIEEPVPGRPRVTIEISIESQTTRPAELEILLHDAFGQNIAIGAYGSLSGTPLLNLQLGRQTVRCSFPAQDLANGRYLLSFKLAIPFVQILDEVSHAVAFDIELAPVRNASRRLLQSWSLGSFLLDLQNH
jgi:homopolymeric O-antigen transport system ATP-binding protein